MTKIVTHNAKFHADDIFAIAVLKLVYPNADVIRTREAKIIGSADIVVDVGHVFDPGRKRFDHHQPGGAGKRENGVPYASFGLVWQEWGKEVSGSDIAQGIVDEKLVMPIDAHDNGFTLATNLIPNIREYTISDFFYAYFYTADQDEHGLYESFMKCIPIAQELLVREIAIARKEERDMGQVEEIVKNTKDKRIIVLDDDLAWHRVLTSLPEPIYVIYKGVEDNWRVKAIPKNRTTRELRKPLPENWGGKNAEELQKESGVKDAVFCHKGLFVCAAESREGAMRLAEIALTH